MSTPPFHAANFNEYFKRAAIAKALPRAAARREPETILLEESDETDNAGEKRKEGQPIPVQVGHRPGDTNRMLKSQFGSTDLDYYPAIYTDVDHTAATKLRTSNK